MPFTMLKARVKDTLAVHKRPTEGQLNKKENLSSIS